MADPNHETVLRGGADNWNKWRGSNPNETPDLVGASFEGAALTYADFTGADLRGANLKRADLRHAKFIDANLIGADLTEAESAWTRWDGATISRSTVLDGIRFTSDHPSLDDGSETVSVTRRDRILNWGHIRKMGSLPLFGVSYVGLTTAIVVILGVDYANRLGLFDATVTVPARMTTLFWSSLFLAIGSTTYRLACPARIQEFSETQWVEQHGRARLQYLAESFKKPILQWPTAFFLALGGGLALGLLLDRVVAVLLALY